MSLSGPERTHHGTIVDEVNQLTVIDCTSCGFRHVHPLPTADMLDAYYQTQYYSGALQPRDAAAEEREWLMGWATDRLHHLETLLPASQRKLLDVGSGTGWFIHTAATLGWTVTGVEPSAAMATYCREEGLDVLNMPLSPSEALQTQGPFDAIVFNTVLEHVPDPRQQLDMARDLLAPNGVICVAVPNDYGSLQAMLRESQDFPAWWVTADHLNYFSPDSLRQLLAAVGFEVLHQTTVFPMDLFLLMGDDYIRRPECGPVCHAKRRAFEAAFTQGGKTELRRALYDALAQVGIGREIVMFARRQEAI